VLAAVRPALAQAGEPDIEFEQAVKLHKAGNLEGAIHAYRVYLESHPTNFLAVANLGAALAGLGRYSEAIEQYQAALELEPANVGLRFNLALAHYKSARIREAASELRAVLATQPDNEKATVLLGDCYLRMAEYKRVIELLSPILNRSSEDRNVLYLLGTALIRDNQPERGQILVDKILRNGESAEAHVMLGSARLKGNDYPGALKEFERAVQLNPKLVSAHAYYGRALLNTGNREKAMEAFLAELQLNPNDFDSNLYLAVILREDHSYEEALRYLERALQIRPGALDVRYQIGSIYVATGKLAQAVQILEELVHEAPNFIEAHVSLATVYYRLKRKDDADRERAIVRKFSTEIQARQQGLPPPVEEPREAEILVPSTKIEQHASTDKALDSGSTTSDAAKSTSTRPKRGGMANGSVRGSTSFDGIAKHADAAREAGSIDRAIELYRMALKLRPSWPEGWWYLGTMLYEHDRCEEGSEALRRLTALDPKAGAGWAMLGLCEYETKSYDQALAHLQRARSLGVASNPELRTVVQYHAALLLTRFNQFEAALEILMRFARRGDDKPAFVEAAGIAGLRKPLLPNELPPTERELVLQVGRAVIDSAARRAAVAQKEFETLLASHPTTPNIHYLFGSLLLLSDPDAGLRELKTELEISPHHLPALLQIAFEYLKRGDSAAALQFAREAVEIDPQSFVAHNALGRAMIESGELDNGIKELELSKRQAPDSPQTRIALASAYAKAGRKEDAARERAEFLKLRQTSQGRGEQ
jgi:tetratricopeptide (TPR) repeat protein